MKIKIISLVCVTLLFFALMAALSLTARDVHQSRLPHVTAARLTRESFSQGPGSVRYRQTAIPKELYHSGDIYIITSRSVNGESRDFAKKVDIEIGLEIDGFYEVTHGLLGHDYVIFSTDRPLDDGDEVLVIQSFTNP